MRAPVMPLSRAAATGLAASLVGLLGLTGCTSPASPAPPPAAKPSASATPPVRFEIPAEVNGLPRTTDDRWLKIPKSKATFLEGKVLGPTTSIAAAYLNPDDISETVEVSAAAGRVVDPAGTLRQLTGNLSIELTDVRPADPGTPGGVGTCGVSRKNRPAVQTVCHWAEPGSVGAVTIWSLKDRRDRLAGLRARIQP